MQRNNIPPPEVTKAVVTDERLTFDREDGRSIGVPLSYYPTLMLASPAERNDFEITHSSVYWPKLDCDINSDALLRGAKEARKYAERAWQRKGQPTQA